MSPQEKKNRRTGFLVSFFTHAALLVLFFFLLAWKEPFPPLPEYGIEVNFGITETGSGEEESEQPSEDEMEDQETEEVVEESEEQVEEVESEPEPTEDISEEIVSETADESESDVSATEENVSKDPVKVEEPVEPAETKKEEKKEEKREALVTYKKGGQKSEGDTKGSGNMGQPDGDKDAQNYEGKVGGGGGASLDLSGWKWERAPIPKDESDAKGRIVFQIAVDRYGKVIRIKTLEKTVSPLVEKLYRDEVLKTKFVKTGGGNVAEQSVGKITFIIKAS